MTAHQKVNIAIIGLGLMGGSLGLALVRSGYNVSGWDRNPDIVKEAFNSRVINKPPGTLQEATANADVIFVATPVDAIPETIWNCLPYVKLGAIFTDLGSIKKTICEAVFQFLPATCHFVAGHPMTGSEQHGLGAADPFLFENAAYLIIEDQRTSSEAFATVIKVIEDIGAQVIKLTADDHDRIVGIVSHLPHLIAAALAKTASLEEELHPGTLNLAAGGFRDTTRIALGSPEIWRGIIFGNTNQVLRAVDSFQKQLDILKEILTSGDQAKFTRFLAQARETRLQLPAKNKGFLSLLHEMVVTIEDRPGAIAQVLRFLADAGLNIKDIEILRIREGDGGTLRLALESDQAVDQAVLTLERHGFRAKKR